MSAVQPTNLQNLPGYLGYVERVYSGGQGTLAEDQGQMQTYPIDAFAGADTPGGSANGLNVTATRTTVTDPNNSSGSWNFGLLDVATSNQPSLSYTVTQNYLTMDLANQSTNSGFGTGFQGNIQTVLANYTPASSPSQTAQNYINLGQTSLGMSLADLYQFYQNHPYNPVDWASSTYWASSPDLQKFKDFFDVVNALNTTSLFVQGSGGNGGAPQPVQFDATPPSSFGDFYNLLEKLKIYQTPGTQAVALAPTNPPDFINSNITSTAVLQTLFADYVQNYVQNISGYLTKAGTGITDIYSVQAFATGWYEFLTSPFTTPSSVPSQLQIILTDQHNTQIPTGTYINVPNYSTGVQLINPNNPPISLNDFVSNFTSKLESDFSTQFNIANDWANTTLNSAPTSAQLASSSFSDQLANSNFETFMHYIINQGGSTAITNYDSFINQWNGFIGPVALLTGNNSNQPNSQSILTYQQIYDVFYPSGSPQHGNFLVHLSSFINGFLTSANAVFNPSLMVDQWFTKMVNNVYGAEAQGPEPIVSLDSADYESVRVLKSIYLGLASMVQSLQSLAVAQANRLNFYTKLQQEYTTVLQQIPVVVTGYAPTFATPPDANNPYGTLGSNVPTQTSGPNPVISDSPINGSDVPDTQARADFNALSGQFIENMRSFRSEIADKGNSFQTAVGQSNQAVNQETTVATQILQSINAIAQYVTNTQPS